MRVQTRKWSYICQIVRFIYGLNVHLNHFFWRKEPQKFLSLRPAELIKSELIMIDYLIEVNRCRDEDHAADAAEAGQVQGGHRQRHHQPPRLIPVPRFHRNNLLAPIRASAEGKVKVEELLELSVGFKINYEGRRE